MYKSKDPNILHPMKDFNTYKLKSDNQLHHLFEFNIIKSVIKLITLVCYIKEFEIHDDKTGDSNLCL